MKTAALTILLATSMAISLSACKEPAFNSSTTPSKSPRKPTDPDRDGVAAVVAHGPGVAEAVGGAGFIGDGARTGHAARRKEAAGRRRAT